MDYEAKRYLKNLFMFNSWHLLQQSTDFCDTSEKVTLLENPESPLFLPGMKKKKEKQRLPMEKQTQIKLSLNLVFPWNRVK